MIFEVGIFHASHKQICVPQPVKQFTKNDSFRMSKFGFVFQEVFKCGGEQITSSNMSW